MRVIVLVVPDMAQIFTLRVGLNNMIVFAQGLFDIKSINLNTGWRQPWPAAFSTLVALFSTALFTTVLEEHQFLGDEY